MLGFAETGSQFRRMMCDSVDPMKNTAREVLRAIRGERSQVAFSRRIGHRTNVATHWEAGRRFPSAVEVIRVAERCGLDPGSAARSFHPAAADAWRSDSVHGWLDALRGGASQLALAERTGCSRHQLGRWLRGDAVPRLPEFLLLVEACTGRVVDFVAALVPIEQVPSLAEEARAKAAGERLLLDHPWSAAVLPLLEAAPHLQAAGVARALGLDLDLALRTIDALERARVIQASADGWRILPFTGRVAGSEAERRALRAHWAAASLRRVEAPGPADVFGFNSFAVSRSDMARVRDAYRAFYREVRSIVAHSSPSETAGMLVVHLAEWDVED